MGQAKILRTATDREPPGPLQEAALPWIIVLLSGCLDAAGLLSLGDAHLAFASGDTVSAGVAIAEGQWSAAGLDIMVVGTFVAGAAIGATCAAMPRVGRPALALLLTGLASLSAALLLYLSSLPWALLPIALGMGAVDTVQRRARIGVGLSYVSGALVDLGMRLSTLARTGWSWELDGLPLALWTGFVFGSGMGALACHRWDFRSSSGARRGSRWLSPLRRAPRPCAPSRPIPERPHEVRSPSPPQHRAKFRKTSA